MTVMSNLSRLLVYLSIYGSPPLTGQDWVSLSNLPDMWEKLWLSRLSGGVFMVSHEIKDGGKCPSTLVSPRTSVPLYEYSTQMYHGHPDGTPR